MYGHERSLVKQLADQPFALVGVNSDDDLEALQDVLKKENITWRSFQNGEKGSPDLISKAWGIQGWPSIFVIDKDGKIRFTDVRGADMDRAIETLLAEMDIEVKIEHEE